jgi:hypothetical protein
VCDRQSSCVDQLSRPSRIAERPVVGAGLDQHHVSTGRRKSSGDDGTAGATADDDRLDRQLLSHHLLRHRAIQPDRTMM